MAIAAEAIAPALQEPVQGAAGEMQACARQSGPQPGSGLAGGGGQLEATGRLLGHQRHQHARHGARLAGARAALQ